MPDLFGDEPPARRPAWRIEISGLGRGPMPDVRVKLIDQENGKTIGAKSMSWAWILGIATGETCEVVLQEGDWS